MSRKRTPQEIQKSLLGHCRATVVEVVASGAPHQQNAFLTCDRHIVGDCARVSCDEAPKTDAELAFADDAIASGSVYVDRSDVLLVACLDPRVSIWNVGDVVLVRPILTKAGGLVRGGLVVGRVATMAPAEAVTMISDILKGPIGADCITQLFTTFRARWMFMIESGTAVMSDALHDVLCALLGGLSNLGFPSTAHFFLNEVKRMCGDDTTWKLPILTPIMERFSYVTWRDLQRSSARAFAQLRDAFGGEGSVPFTIDGISETGEFHIRVPHTSLTALFVVGVKMDATSWSLFWFESESTAVGSFKLVQGRPRELVTFLQMAALVDSPKTVQGFLLQENNVLFCKERGNRPWVVSEPSQQRHIDGVTSTPEDLLENVCRTIQSGHSVCILGASGTGKSHLVSRTIEKIHAFRKISCQETMKDRISKLQSVRKKLSEKTTPLELAAAYSDQIAIFADIMAAQSSQAILVISDLKSSAHHTATLSKTFTCFDLHDPRSTTCRADHVKALRAVKGSLLSNISKTVWYCTGEERMPLPAVLSCLSKDLLDAFGILSQATLDQWLGTPTLEVVPSAENLGLFSVPPATANDTLPSLSLVNPWKLSPEARSDYARLCCEITVRGLCEWYDEVFSEVNDLTSIIQELSCDRSPLNRVSSSLLVASLDELRLPGVRNYLTVLNPNLVVLEDNESATLTMLAALLPNRVQQVAVCSRKPFPLHVSVHLQQQWRHSDEVRIFLNSIRHQSDKTTQDYEFAMQSLSASSSIGVAEKAFIWVTAAPDPTVLANMARGLTKYILDSNGFSSFALLVPNQADICHFESFASSRCAVATFDSFAGNEADVVIIAVFGEGVTLPSFVAAASCSKFRVYAIAWSGWCEATLPPSVTSNPEMYGASLHLICDRHAQKKPIFVEYDINEPTFQSSFEMPLFGKWCTLVCMQSFKPTHGKCSSSHLCDKVCSECDGDHAVCPHPCERLLPCGHPCTKLCNEPCEESSCGNQTVVENACLGTRILVGYDVHTKQGKYQTFHHYQEVACGAAILPCKELVTKNCEGCGNEITGVVCSTATPTTCPMCESMGPIVLGLTKEKNLLLQRQRAIALHKNPMQKSDQLDVEQKRCEQSKKVKAKYTTMSLEVTSSRNAKSAQYVRHVQCKCEASKRDLSESTAFLEDFLARTYMDHCKVVRRLVGEATYRPSL